MATTNLSSISIIIRNNIIKEIIDKTQTWKIKSYRILLFSDKANIYYYRTRIKHNITR